MKKLLFFGAIIALTLLAARSAAADLKFSAGDRVSLTDPFYKNCQGIVMDVIVRSDTPGESVYRVKDFICCSKLNSKLDGDYKEDQLVAKKKVTTCGFTHR
jgi:hypothetical protein